MTRNEPGGYQSGGQYGGQYGSQSGNQYGSQSGNQYGSQSGNQYGSQSGYQPGNQYGYEGQQSYGDQQQRREQNYPSDQNRPYDQYGQHPSPAPPHYGDAPPGYDAQSYSAPNSQPYRSYPGDHQAPPIPHNTRPHDSPYAPSPGPYPNPSTPLAPHGTLDHTTGNADYYNPPDGPPPNWRADGQAPDSDRGFAGALAGGAAGAYGGHKVHHGFLGTVGGAIAGSMAENAYKKHSHEKKEEEERRRHEEEEEEERRRREQGAAMGGGGGYYRGPQGPPQQGPQNFAGNFGASSRGMHLEGSRLRAECKGMDGGYHRTELELNDCLTNENGRMGWARGGNFAASARGLRLVEDGTVLEGEADDGSGGWRHNRVWLNERITNEDGRLKMMG